MNSKDKKLFELAKKLFICMFLWIRQEKFGPRYNMEYADQS